MKILTNRSSNVRAALGNKEKIWSVLIQPLLSQWRGRRY
jgi:hypothetical protein